MPYYGKYRIRQELIVLHDEKAKVHRLVKVPLLELPEWDASHDVLGQKIGHHPAPIDDDINIPEKKDLE